MNIFPDIRRIQTEAAVNAESARAYTALIIAEPTHRHMDILKAYACKFQDRAAQCYRKLETLQEDLTRRTASDARALRNASI